ncbi:MAG TPA: hypothetical protein VGM84_19950 [Steroidobacteraceae bacterium]
MHLAYEIGMLHGTADLLSLGQHAGTAQNALLESFTVHARSLFDFLQAASPRDDDVIAEDFFQAPETWDQIRLQEPIAAALKTARGRVNKEIAHLTYERLTVTPEQKGWAHQELRLAMDLVLARFVKSMDRISGQQLAALFPDPPSKGNVLPMKLKGETTSVTSTGTSVHLVTSVTTPAPPAKDT